MSYKEHILKYNNLNPVVKTALKSHVKKAILDLLLEKQSCYFGDMVEELPYSHMTILENLLELKNKGVVLKNENPPRYSLSPAAYRREEPISS